MGALLAYNRVVWDQWALWVNSYSSRPRSAQTAGTSDWFEDIAGTLISPERGLLVLSPFLLLLLPGLPAAWRTATGWARSAAVGGVGYLALQPPATISPAAGPSTPTGSPWRPCPCAAPILFLCWTEWTARSRLRQQLFGVLAGVAVLQHAVGAVAFRPTQEGLRPWRTFLFTRAVETASTAELLFASLVTASMIAVLSWAVGRAPWDRSRSEGLQRVRCPATRRPPVHVSDRKPGSRRPARVDTGDVTSRDDAASRRRDHWDDRYSSRGSGGVSWFQDRPTASLRLIAAAGLERSASLVDVGGGAATLVDELVAGGWSDVTVLDVSDVALEEARRRVGADRQVQWIEQDLLTWQPSRRYDVWHDRAVFHFLVEEEERQRYRMVLRDALAPGGTIIVGAFAADGPTHCSGLPVARYDGAALVAALGGAFDTVATLREEHITPAGGVQPFTWVALRAAERAAVGGR